ncbi:MAG: hypothetical protein ACQSGP_26970 [Frankia sp.]
MPAVVVGVVLVAGVGAFIKLVRSVTKTLSEGPAIESDTTYDNYAEASRRHGRRQPSTFDRRPVEAVPHQDR